MKQGNNFGDNLVLALDSAECIQVLSTHIESFFSVSCLQAGDAVLGNFLDQFGGSVGHIREEHGGVSLQTVVKRRIVDFCSLECLVKEVVLDYDHLDLCAEALSSQATGSLGIHTGYVYQVEVSVFLYLFTELLDDDCFIFLSHDSILI